MYDLETIKEMNKEAGGNAKVNGINPLVFNEEAMNLLLHCNNIEPIRSMPDLGDNVPEGWKRFNLGKIKEDFTYSYKIHKDDANGKGAFFVDQGYGADDEPAMTISQFIKSLSELWNKNKRLGYGMVETGQFQTKIGVFEEVSI
jgi:hypothetical protein